MRIRFAALAAGIALCAIAPASWAQAWPSKPVKIIAVFPPGGSVDQVSRIFAAQLTTQLGQQVIVDNKGGASGSIGAAAIAASPPDGYTFGVVFDTHAVNPSLIPNLAFDTLKDLAPVMLVGTSPMAIVAHTSQPYKDFRDVLAAAKAKPGAVSFGSIGTGSLGHLAMAQIGNLQKLEFTHVPYRGGGPLMTDAIGGQVPLAIGTVFLVKPHVQGGKVKALAVTSAKPDPALPGVAPVAEQGVPGFAALAWWASWHLRRRRRPSSSAWKKNSPGPSARPRLRKSSPRKAWKSWRGRSRPRQIPARRDRSLGRGGQDQQDQGGGLMRIEIACLVLAALAAGCAVSPEPAPAPAQPAPAAAAAPARPADAALTGAWVPVLAELGAQEFKFGQDFRLSVTGNRYDVAGGPAKDMGRLEFVDGDPKGFDVVGEEGPNKGKRFPAIYRFLPDGRLEVCYDLEGIGRPAAFATFPGTKLFKVIYRRR